MTLQAPGLNTKLTDAEHRATPALSATSAKWILRSPAHYQHRITHPTTTPAFSLGHAVHTKVLGIGAPVVTVPEDICAKNGAWSTTAAKDFIEQARAEGKTVLKAEDIADVNGMAEAVLAHPLAKKLLALPGDAEVSINANDPETGVPLKARLDYLPHHVAGRRTIPVDLKTTNDASLDGFTTSIAKYGYYLQGAMCRYLIELTRGDETAPFTLIAVETEPPYAVAVHDVSGEFADFGKSQLRRAIDRYAECLDTGEWPAYPPVIHHPHTPLWLTVAADRQDEIE